MKRSLLILTAVLAIAAFLAPVLPSKDVAAQAGNGYDLISAVNQLRASLGLGALHVDPILMSIAQGQSDYQASIGTWSHEGPGGSSPRDRAIAAGFGGGATVFISENVAVMNTSASFNTLIYSIWSDQLHWNTMTNPNYTHAGAGVTVADGEVYYTLDVGYIAGNPGGSYVPAPSYTPGGPQAAATEATPNWIIPVITATPHDDGEVIHVSEAGQSLWSIAIAYGTTIKEIVELNGLDTDNPVIWPGDELIIRPALDATITPTPTITRPLPSRTPTPTRTIRPANTRVPTQTPTATPEPGLNIQLPSIYAIDRQKLGIGIIALCSLGLITVLFSGFRPRK